MPISELSAADLRALQTKADESGPGGYQQQLLQLNDHLYEKFQTFLDAIWEDQSDDDSGGSGPRSSWFNDTVVPLLDVEVDNSPERNVDQAMMPEVENVNQVEETKVYKVIVACTVEVTIISSSFSWHILILSLCYTSG